VSAPAPSVGTPPDASRGKAAGFIQGFDGLRAIAALLVVVVHVALTSGYTNRANDHSSRLGDFTARGEIGVSVFFLISGFLLYRPFVASALAGRPGPGVRSYLVRRGLRIVPLYWIALLFTCVLGEWHNIGGVSGLLGHAFFLQIYSNSWILHGINQAWSLCIEVTFYLALPLWAAGLRSLDRRRDRTRTTTPEAILRRELVVLAGLYVASLLFRWWADSAGHGQTHLARNWLPAYADHFALGMALAVVSTYVAQTGKLPAAVRWLTKPGADLVSWILAGLIFYLASRHIGLTIKPLDVGGARVDLKKEVLYGFFGFFLLLPAVFGRPRTGLVRRLLASRVLSLIGLVSYGIYLWHQLVVSQIQKHTSWTLFNAPFLGLLGVTVVITLAISTITYLGVERPGIAVGHRWLLRQRERAAEHPAS
jgi:peptidoglycan/LPS O-acetylase OafA/YrhL